MALAPPPRHHAHELAAGADLDPVVDPGEPAARIVTPQGQAPAPGAVDIRITGFVLTRRDHGVRIFSGCIPDAVTRIRARTRLPRSALVSR